MHPRVSAALTESQVTYIQRKHSDCHNPIRSPQDFAKCLGYELNRITKTLFVRSINRDKYALLVAPMGGKINFATVADILSCPRVEVAGTSELATRIGYPPTGVSPLGVSEIPILIDTQLSSHETILVGGGIAGVEVEIAPNDLIDVTGAKLVRISL